MGKSLEPGELVRLKDIGKYIPLGPTQIRELVIHGLLGKPFPLVPGGRAKAVFKSKIIAYVNTCAAESAKLNEPRCVAPKRASK
jgi:hypothetical protein